jgi:integrase
MHKLRHTHATALLADSEIAIADVSARLGHAKISHTLDMYTHARPEQDKKIANKIDELYKKKKSSHRGLFLCFVVAHL